MAAGVNQAERFHDAVRRLEQLQEFAGPERVFWFQLLTTMAGVSNARFGVILRAGPEHDPGWEIAARWPAQGVDESLLKVFCERAGDLAEAAVQQGGALRGSETVTGIDWCVSVRMTPKGEPGALVMAFHLESATEGEAAEAMRRLRLLTPLQTLYRLRQQATDSETAVGHFAAVLDLVSALNAHQRFLPVAMTLCNELATRHQCDRVSLGWMENGYARVIAISRSERFERKMDAIKKLEAAMEEAVDQDEAIVWPESSGPRMVTRAHEEYSKSANVPSLCSMPLRLEGEPVAVLVAERSTEPFVEVEVRLLALYGEMSIRRLADLKRTDRWFGARWMLAARERLTGLLGPEHVLAKLSAVLAIIALILLAVIRVDYRVEAPFILRTEDLSYISAPFNGYLEEVKVDVGDEVKKDAVMASLDSRDLLLEEASAAAEQTRFSSEVEKATGADKPAEMRIAQSQADEAKARLEIIRYRRSHANIVAPFDGLVVEGDLKKRVGSAVKQGEVLIRVARIDRIYVECNVNERDIPYLQPSVAGEVAFTSLPKHKFSVRLSRIEPAAFVKESGNTFAVRCSVESPRESWWRPGMSGTAKLNAGHRSLLWVVTHRTVDFLRMQLWW